MNVESMLMGLAGASLPEPDVGEGTPAEPASVGDGKGLSVEVDGMPIAVDDDLTGHLCVSARARGICKREAEMRAIGHHNSPERPGKRAARIRARARRVV